MRLSIVRGGCFETQPHGHKFASAIQLPGSQPLDHECDPLPDPDAHGAERQPGLTS